MSALEYNAVLEQATRLSPPEKADLLAELANQLRGDAGNGRKHGIAELRGLGKEIWRGIDAQEYVNRERDSWNG